jgi:hypothetical protein
LDLYGNYVKYADQATSPTGSLIEFNKFKNQISSKISEDYSQFKILLPDLDESKIKEYVKQQEI